MGLYRVLRQTARGCTTLPHVGGHPGTMMLLIFLLAGGVAGAARGGLWGAIGGAGLMALFMVPMYLIGAYGRAQSADRHSQGN